MKSMLTVAALVIFLAWDSPAVARGLGKLVTKETQEKLGLDFDLSATSDDDSALIILRIPKAGKLKDVQEVRLSISADNQKHFLVRAPLEMRDKDGAISVSAQLSPELANKAAIDLVMEQGRREFFYHVRLSDYITRARQPAIK